MGCGCNKRIDPEIALRLRLEESMCEPTGWGPILWRYLHALTEQLGNGNNEEEADGIQIIFKMLPLVIPCRQCQKHASDYILSHPLPRLRDLRGSALRNAARQWLFLFHTAVREDNNQPVIVSTLQDCQNLHANGTITKAEYTQFIHCVASATRNGWVKLENWRKWYGVSEKLRQTMGNIIV